MSKDFSCKIPAKTFVLGEYSVTQDGRAVVLLTEPCFEAEFYHESSVLSPPIDKFVAAYPAELAGSHCKLTDPYGGLGGFGASSAEFLAWIKYYYYCLGLEFDIDNPKHYQQALQCFLAANAGRSGLQPSGADMIAQSCHGLTTIDLHSASVAQISWPFTDFGLCVAHTGNKVTTHKHLSALSMSFNFAALSRCVLDFEEAIAAGSFAGVAGSINNACLELDNLGLLHANSKKIIKSVMQQDFCLAAKGCGAMGADVVLFVFRLDMLAQTKSFVRATGLGFDYYFCGGG